MALNTYKSGIPLYSKKTAYCRVNLIIYPPVRAAVANDVVFLLWDVPVPTNHLICDAISLLLLLPQTYEAAVLSSHM
jgi:hypothetical protein